MEEVDEAEDEEEVVDAGGRAGLRAAASAAATVGRMEGMSSGCRLGPGSWGGPVVTWRPGGRIWSAAAGEGGAGLWPSPSGLGWARVLQCARLCGLASAGGNSSRGLHSGAGVGGSGSSGVCSGGVGGPLGGVGVPRREGGGMGGDCAVGCAVSVYSSARRGALAWPVVGRAVWRRSLPSSAAAARISQTRLRIWWTSWSVVGRGYASFGLRPARLRTLWMAWYPQVRDCCCGGGGFGRVSGPARTCVWAVGMAQTQGKVPVGGQRRWIQRVRQSMANPRW